MFDGQQLELEGTYYYYPEKDGNICLTFIMILSDRYNLCGIRIGDTLAAARNSFSEFGFCEDKELREKYGSKYFYFVNDGCTITVQCDSSDKDTITLLQIGFTDESMNQQGAQ